LISKELVERVLDSYLNVLYEYQSKGINNKQWTNGELMKEIVQRVNNKSPWFCKTKKEKENKPSWVR